MTSSPHDWDGAAYQQVSDPQFRWGMRVLDSVALRGDECALDLGCGSGRLTAELLSRLPRGRVIAVDASPSMISTARELLAARFGERVTYIQSDALELELDSIADLAFSTATFHWIHDHARLFRVIHRALKPGGRLVAQCGGGANLERIRGRAQQFMSEARFAPFFRDWHNPWNYASPEETAERLRTAGFVEAETGLEEAPTTFAGADAFRQFARTVVLRPYLATISDEVRREEFLEALVAQTAGDSPPFTLDYWRLNLRGQKH
ncbi:MAG: methyltransferase domain-containing protein [Acidobacteriota bacterium]|nr:methyltransferase domain-containing protein [Acidobacteriota bacterium]